MATIRRTLQVKRMVAINGDRFPAIAPLAVHDAMAVVFGAAVTVGDRHYPSREKITPGKRCVFLEPVAKKGNSVLFQAYAYTAGHTPDQVVQDFDAKTAEITTDPIMADGERVEVVERFACLVLGDTLIIEHARVFGSADLAIAAIRDLIRRHYMPKFPRLRLEDAPNRGFKHLAAIHGGVVKVTARLNKAFVPEPQSFGKSLEQLVTARKMPNFKQVSATIEAEENAPLDPDQVLSIVDESDGNTGLTGVSVEFADRTTLSDLEKYRERHTVEVQEVRPGVPAVTEIETALVDYLGQLASPDDVNTRVIDEHGIFIEK